MKYLKYFGYGVIATVLFDLVFTILSVSTEFSQAELQIEDELESI